MHEDGCCIGTATRGLDIAAPVVLTREDRQHHVHLIGKTGVGKSTLLRALMHDDLVSGQSFALLDPLGGLAEAVANAIPSARNDETIYLDPGGDLEHCIGFNPLDRVPRDKRHLVADHVVSAFMHIWGANLEDTPRLIYILYHGIRLLLDVDGSTLLGLPRLLIDDKYRGRLLRSCTENAVAGFWANEFAAYDERFRVQVISPIQNKIGMLLAPPALRNILGQKRSTIDIARLMNVDGGIFIANLSKGRLGTTGAHLLGAMLATTIAHVAEERASIDFNERLPFTLYCDEVQNFATTSFASVLSEARNFRLHLVLAHQFLGQLPLSVQEAIIGNCGTSIVFRVGADDARRLAAELDMDNHAALSNTPNRRAWVRLLQDGVPTEPIFVETLLPEAPAQDRKAAVIAHTRARHTRRRASVEAAIARQQQV